MDDINDQIEQDKSKAQEAGKTATKVAAKTLAKNPKAALFVLAAITLSLALYGFFSLSISAFTAGKSVLYYSLNQAKEAISTAVTNVSDAFKYVADKGIVKGIKNIVTGKFKYRYVEPWYPLIQKSAAKWRVDPRFVAAIMYQETRGVDKDGEMTKYGKAIGLMQILEMTARGECGMSASTVKIPERNFDCGARKIGNDLRGRARGDYFMAAACYLGYDPGKGLNTYDPVAKKSSGGYAWDVMQYYADLQQMFPA